MMSNEKYISIENMIWRMLFGWKFIIFLAISCALLLPLGKYAYDRMNYAKEVELIESQKEELMIELTDEEKEDVEAYVQIVERIEELEHYQENAFYTTVNPLYARSENIEFSVFADENVEEILEEYVAYFSSAEFVDSVIETYDISKDEIEMLRIHIEDVFKASFSLSEEEEEEEEVYKFRLSFLYEEGGTIGGTQLKYEDLYQMVLQQILNDSRFTMTAQQTTKISTDGIRNNKFSLQNMINDFVNEKTVLEEGFTESQKIYINEKGLGEIEVEEVVEGTAPTFSIKFILVGGLLGIIFGCAIIFVKVLFSGELQTVDEISNFYGVRTLGVFKIEKKQSKTKGIDNILWQTRYKNMLDETSAAELVLANIKIALKNSGKSQLFISRGSKFGEITKLNWYKDIVHKLELENIEIVEGESIIKDAQSYMNMCQLGTVLFVEAVDVSKYQEIEHQIAMAKDSNVEIIGCIVVA